MGLSVVLSNPAFLPALAEVLDQALVDPPRPGTVRGSGYHPPIDTTWLRSRAEPRGYGGGTVSMMGEPEDDGETVIGPEETWYLARDYLETYGAPPESEIPGGLFTAMLAVINGQLT